MAFIDELRTIRDNMTAALKALSAESKDGVGELAYRDHLLKGIVDMDKQILEIELRSAVEIREMGVA